MVALRGDGTIAARGAYDEVLAKDETLAREAAREEDRLAKVREEIEDPGEDDEEDIKTDGQLVVKEEIAEGHVSLRARE